MATDTLDTPAGTSIQYHVGESLFGAVAVRCLDRGWTLIPQERGDRRRSALIDGRALKWGEYVEKAPSREEMEHWARQAPTANGAILLGVPSGLTWGLDLDVLEKRIVSDLVVLADEIFGATPFFRQGRAPKTAMIYRVAREEDLPANRSYRFEGNDDAMLEIQARGRLLTAFGYHHQTERYFGWEGAQPGSHPTTDARLTTPAQLEEFIERAQLLRSFSKKVGSGAIEFIEGDGSLEVTAEGWTIPHRSGGIVDPRTGLVIDDREAYLRALCFNLIRLNPERAAASPQTALEVAYAHAMRTIGEGKKRFDVRSNVVDKIKRGIAALRAGEITHLPEVKVGSDGKRSVARRGVLSVTADPDLWHLPAPDKRQALEFRGRTAPDPMKAAARALVPNRDGIAIDVEGGIIGAFDSFFDGVYAAPTDTLSPIHIVKAPTGAGKTTKVIRYIAGDARTYEERKLPNGDPQGPILFLLPTYANIAEVRARAQELHLDPSLDDEELKRQASDIGLVAEDDINAAVADARSAASGELKTMVYKGKVAAGCAFPEMVKALQEAGISSSGLCHAVIKHRDGPDEERFCQHYATCGAILQKQEIAVSHVVFLPHAFLSLTIPKELQNARAIITDERIFPLAVHTTRMKMTTLAVGREPPPLTKKEREQLGNDRDRIHSRKLDYIQDRVTASEIVTAALRQGQDPAATLAKWSNGKLRGTDLVASALRVCGSASSRNVVIHPGMLESTFAEIVRRPTGTEIAMELRFWRLVEERMTAIADRTARQSRDQRIQRLVDTLGEQEIEYIRLSWRSEMNWGGAPTLLLDASADRRIAEKVFDQREVIIHDVDAPLNMKTVLIVDSSRSTTSLLPAADITSAVAQVQARNVERVRAVETVLAARHADGAIVVGMAKGVRAARSEFAPAGNVDTMHFGAERGLNFAENHRAALAVGRMELPVWMLDGYAAALGHDDADELVLLDPRGDGTDANGDPLKPTVSDLVIPMRDGSDVTIETAKAPAGTWQRTVQIQFREESLRQFAGRLRPIYRSDTPILYLMGKVLPEGIFVDDIVTTGDLIPSYSPLLDARRGIAGILDPYLAAKARPDLATRDGFVKMMSDLPEQLRTNYYSVRYVAHGETRHAGVPGWLIDPAGAMEAMLDWADIEATEVAVVREPKQPFQVPAAARPLDAVEIAMGDQEQRLRAEAMARIRAIDWINIRHEDNLSHQPYVAGRGRYPVAVGQDGKVVELGLSAIGMLRREVPKTDDKDAVHDDEGIAI